LLQSGQTRLLELIDSDITGVVDWYWGALINNNNKGNLVFFLYSPEPHSLVSMSGPYFEYIRLLYLTGINSYGVGVTLMSVIVLNHMPECRSPCLSLMLELLWFIGFHLTQGFYSPTTFYAKIDCPVGRRVLTRTDERGCYFYLLIFISLVA